MNFTLNTKGNCFADGGGRGRQILNRLYSLFSIHDLASFKRVNEPHTATVPVFALSNAAAIPSALIKKGISEADLRGRIEVIISGGVKYVLDGAHNPAAFAPVCGFLKNENPENVTAVYGCLSDKDIDGCLKRLSATAENVICVRCPSPRALSADDVYAACAKYFKRVNFYPAA